MVTLETVLKVFIALVSLALLLNNAKKVKEYIQPSQPVVNVTVGQPSLAEKAKSVSSDFLDWLGGSTQVGSHQIPNWGILLGGIVFLFALFRR